MTREENAALKFGDVVRKVATGEEYVVDNVEWVMEQKVIHVVRHERTWGGEGWEKVNTKAAQ